MKLAYDPAMPIIGFSRPDLRRGSSAAPGSLLSGRAARRIGKAWPSVDRRWVRASPYALIALVAAVNLAVSISANPLFGDEAFSVGASDAALSDVLGRVRDTEIAPPGYYFILWAWLRLGPEAAEWWVRIPSVAFAIGTVCACAWLGALVGSARVAVWSALLTSVSPLLVQYGQQARAYSLATFLVVVASAALVRARGSASPTRWLTLSCGAVCAGVLVHYTVVLVAAPLCVCVAMARALTRRTRVTYVLCVLAAVVAISPLAVAQFARGSTEHPSAGLTANNAVRAASAPFDGRYRDVPLGFNGFAAMLMVAGCALAFGRRGKDPVLRRLVLIGATPTAAVLVATAMGSEALWTRYTAVGAPLLTVATVAGLIGLRSRALSAVAMAAAVALGCVGSALSHDPDHGYYASTRQAAESLAAWRQSPGVIVLSGDFTTDASLRFYLADRVPAARVVPLESLSGLRPPVVTAITGPYSTEQIRTGLRGVGYRLASVRAVGRGIQLKVARAVKLE